MPAAEQMHLTQLVLTASPSIEKIYLLGSTQMQRRTQSIFHFDQPTSRYTAHHFILVLATDTTPQSLNNLEDAIETCSQQWIPVTAIVLSIETFINQLKEGHLFATRVSRNAEELYSAGNILLPPSAPTNEEKLEAEGRKLLFETNQKVQSFLAGADLYRIRKEYKLAAFMLHQAAEQQLRTMLILNTGLRVNTHSIERLMRNNCMCCDKLLDIFPKQSERSKKLFTLLQKAYIDSRYSIDYNITGNELEELSRKVKNIIEIATSG